MANNLTRTENVLAEENVPGFHFDIHNVTLSSDAIHLNSVQAIRAAHWCSLYEIEHLEVALGTVYYVLNRRRGYVFEEHQV
ncbi:unnamed protein product [Rotaria sp. Silwood1]|nr:unnamed protein product [Rotaria sp. Silwood1]